MSALLTGQNTIVGSVLLLIGVLMGAFIRSRPTLRKIEADREANLLSERAKEMAEMRAKIEKLEAERAVDRHRINNLSQCLDALLLLIEQDPGKASEAAAKIRKMRSEQLERETREKAAIRAAAIKAGLTELDE